MRSLRCMVRFPVRCTALAVLALASLLVPTASFTQTTSPPRTAHANEAKAPSKPSAPAKADSASPNTLPVKSVVLYKNGVGYFEHLGQVTGNQHVAIDFTTSQLNDVLQSLTVLDDNGGRIGGVNYNSTTPLAEQLKSLSLAMSDDPTSTELFQALRGQKVEVAGAPGGSFSGRLMSIESRAQTALPVDTGSSPDNDAAKPAQARFYLTLVANSGAVRVIELLPTLSVRPLDPSLQGQLDRYLELLSSTHTTGLRHLSLDALAGSGSAGPRQLRVSYISEVPVWKSTYRIVFPKSSGSSESGSAILQGWAVVDNTIGSDWDNVQLSLVAGAPQSFIQPLSDPLYLRRPEVPISTEAQSTPQTHEAAEMETAAAPPPRPVASAGAPMAAPNHIAMSSAMRNKSVSQGFGVAGMEGTGSGAGLGSGSGNGYGPGTGGNTGGGIYRVGDTNVDENITTNAFDDFFQYALAQPVTIHKNESAMVPILQQTLPVERVTLWSASEPKPLRALWLDNTSKLTFDSGNFSVFESGAFAGEGLLDPIHPAEKRLLSYATDQAVRVRPHAEPDKRELRRVRIVPHAAVSGQAQLPGHVAQDFAAQSRTTYNVSNSADEPRTVVLEVPRSRNRTLAPDSKPAESTADLYRFRVQVAAHQSATQLVADEGLDRESWQISTDLNQNASQFSDPANYLRGLGEQAHAQDSPGSDPADSLATQLKPLIASLQSIADDKTHLDELQKQRDALTTEETRTRENLTALKGNEGSKRFVEALNRSEDALEQNRQQTESTQAKVKTDGEALHQLLQTTTIEWQSPNWTAPAK